MSTNFPSSLDNLNNPSGTTKLNDPDYLHHEQHSNANDSIEALEQKVGIDVSSINTTLDFARYLYFLTETQHSNGTYKEIVGNPFPTSVTWYTNSFKTTKLVDKLYTYGPGSKKFVTQVQYRLYSSGIIVRTITDSITLSNSGTGPFEENRTRTIT
jgi:hypothetical protein